MAEVDPFHALLPELEKVCRVVRWRPGSDDWKKELSEIEGIYVYAHINVDGPLMDEMPKLKVVSNFGVDLNTFNEDELLEVTPCSLRLRKKYLDPNERKRNLRDQKEG